MKPVRLEMTAFGSYAQPTTVDFQKLSHSLYLITGDTGAGKTTIFDGIMVALYGVASGKGDNKARTFDIMHCDYVEKSVDTKVALSFSHMGKLYRVERTLHFKKKRETGEYEKTTPSAILWEPDRAPLEKTELVTKRMNEILGMNAEQFRRIAMLAQGEFKRFLDADSEEKNKILGELFDSSAYVYFQELFDTARKKLEQERQEKGTEQIKRVMEDFLYPDDMDEEERAVYSAGYPGLEEALCRLRDGDDARCKTWRRREQECREQEQELHRKKGRAEEQNRQLEELAEKEAAYNGLQEKKADMEALQRQVERAERAFYRVRPKEEAAQKAETDYAHGCREVEEAKRRLDKWEKERQDKGLAWEEIRQAEEPVIAKLAIRIDSLEKSIPVYGDLEENRKRQEDEREQAKKAGERRRLVEERKKQLAGERESCKESIRELEGADVRRERFLAELDRAADHLDKLIAKDGILAQTEKIKGQEEALHKEREELRNLTLRSGELETRYHNLYQAFLNGQAGILAGRLERELAEQGEAVCPVCHTSFCGRQGHVFAKQEESTPEKKEVDEARAAFEEEDSKRQEKSRKIAKLETAVNGDKESVTGKMQELEPACEGWETLCRDGYLEEIESRYRQQKRDKEAAFELAGQQSRRLAELKEQAQAKEKAVSDCERELEESREEEQLHLQAQEKLETEEAALIKSLQYFDICPDTEAAQRRKAEWEEEKKQREQRMEQALAVYNEADRKYEETKGSLRAGREALPRLEQERKETARKYREAMTQAGFESAQEAAEALAVTGEDGAGTEHWIAERRAKLSAYENALKNSNERIAELRDRTKEQEYINLEELEADIQRQARALEEIQEQSRICERLYENHRAAAEAVQKAGQRLKETEGAWVRLDNLASLANGSNAAGGRLSFDRYVMGYVFREILEMANRRLDVMSGGRYELLHEIQARRGNAAAGLEVSVFDMTTGKSRPSQSLSGGESFLVSMALALGLSDVVQNHAGGKQLDALFIDEGFGFLDSDMLDRALLVLNRLTEGNCLVGIISHVDRLEESIPQQIRVKNSEKGSFLEIVQ